MNFIKTILISLFIFNSSQIYSQNCQNTSTGRPPLLDLGTGHWHGYQGGLYPNGSNIRPASHNNGGLMMASQVRPLDTAGNYDPVNGSIVWLSIGMSNTTQETQQFIPLTDTFQNKNPKLILVDGAQGGQHINIIIDSTANFWNVIKQRLAQRGLTVKQVQAVWFKEAEAGPMDTSFPNYAVTLKNKFRTVMNILKNKYYNVRLCYLSCRIYAGYATTGLNPEPYAYYCGWSVKWLIEDQINGDTNLRYTGNNPRSPWLSWGPYIWADGVIPNLENLTWICPDDFQSDGTHPSIAGRRKVANKLFQFFTTDQTSIPWFLNNPTGINNSNSIPDEFVLFQNYPNPFNASSKIKIQISKLGIVNVTIYNPIGREVETLVNMELQPGTYELVWDAGNYASGVYFYRLVVSDKPNNGGSFVDTKKMVLIK
ncbi:MAG: T9SS type A sorting domain-containing protein [Ignavibacteria bacterium]